jgi:hypothetical protein
LRGTGPWPEILPLTFSSVCPCRTSITNAMQLPFYGHRDSAAFLD